MSDRSAPVQAGVDLRVVVAVTRGLMLRPLGEPLQAQRLLMRQLPDKHFRGAHHHL